MSLPDMHYTNIMIFIITISEEKRNMLYWHCKEIERHERLGSDQRMHD